MTATPHKIPHRTARRYVGQTIRVQWSATIAAPRDRMKVCAPRDATLCHVSFVATLELVSEHHALLEAWIGTPTGERPVLRRQPVTCTIASDDGLLHVDAELDDRRVLALTLDTAGKNERLLYVRTTLLAEAGFAPGAHDPPVASMLTESRDAASA
jgi:hypothetical protein